MVMYEYKKNVSLTENIIRKVKFGKSHINIITSKWICIVSSNMFKTIINYTFKICQIKKLTLQFHEFFSLQSTSSQK